MVNFNKLDNEGNIIEIIPFENKVDSNNGIEFEVHALMELSKDNDFNWQMVDGTGLTSNQLKPVTQNNPANIIE
jgi:hypothetical protein